MAYRCLPPQRDSSPSSTTSTTPSIATEASSQTSVTDASLSPHRLWRKKQQLLGLIPGPLLKTSTRSPPLRLLRADGRYLTVADGDKTRNILDASGGAAVSNLGHNESRMYTEVDFLRNDGIAYAPSGTFIVEVVSEFGEDLLESTDYKMAQVAFYGSGSESVEAGLKLGYQYHSKYKKDADPNCCTWIAREQSYHGASNGSLGVSGHKARQDPYKRLLPNNTRYISPCYTYRGLKAGQTEADYVAELANELERTIREIGANKVAGFIAEPVVGAALGCVPAPRGYLREMKKVCRMNGVLFILDEIMCGAGRTGYFHAWQEENVVPDIQLMGKGLGGGYAAFSAMLVGHRIVDAMGDQVFAHGHTFQNFAPSCAFGRDTMRIIRDDKLLEKVRVNGEKLMAMLNSSLAIHPNVGDIRGKGYFRGIEFVKDKKNKTPFDSSVDVACRIQDLGLTAGYGIYVYPGTGTVDGIHGDHIIIAPAYNCTDADLEAIVERISRVIVDFFAALPEAEL